MGGCGGGAARGGGGGGSGRCWASFHERIKAWCEGIVTEDEERDALLGTRTKDVELGRGCGVGVAVG
jgi:hypothetical protein